MSEDALMRVYIHKLRRTLGDYYSKAGGGSGHAVHIPRGEYRLVVTVNSVPDPDPDPDDPAPRLPEPVPVPPHGSSRMWLAPSMTLLLVGTLIGSGILWPQTPRPLAAQIRTNPVCSWLQHDDRPTLIVVGDYYLVGETDDSMEVKQLIREYAVNSKGDLDLYIQQHPGVANRYIDVGVRYIPTGVAYALRDVVPVLAADAMHIGVRMMSERSPRLPSRRQTSCTSVT